MTGSGDNHEERITKLEVSRQQLEDSMVVHALLESKATTRLKEHSEFLKAHEEVMGHLLRSQRSLAEFYERSQHEHEQFKIDHEIAMKEFDGKLNALIDIVGRMQGGMEARNS